MSNFILEDTEDFDIEIDLSSLKPGRKTREKREPRSLQELKVHYLNFCANRDLDSSILPEEQISYCEKDQMWLDAHVAEIRSAQREKRLYARGKTQQLRNMLMNIKQKTGDTDGEHSTDVAQEKNVINTSSSAIHTAEINTQHENALTLKTIHKNGKPDLSGNQLSLF